MVGPKGRLMNNPEAAQSDYVRVTDVRGVQAVAERIAASSGDRESLLRLRLEDGRTLVIAESEVELSKDGGYYFPGAFEQVPARHVQTTDEIKVPVIEERLDVHKQVREVGKVEIRKSVREEKVVINEVLTRDDVAVERVPVNQYITEPASIRYENDTMIVPVLEEVLVVEKRLLLREELRVTRRQLSEHRPETVTLRHEDVSVERTELGKKRDER